MNIVINPRKLSGTVSAIPSKSQAHRLLICAAFADRPTTIQCSETNQDIDATARCLNALGAEIVRTSDGYQVTPVTAVPKSAVLPCRESGSTLRFLLPVAGALGVDCTFLLEGRLSQRPLSPLWELMENHGCHLSRSDENSVNCEGKLNGGVFAIRGNVSSQFISGLLFASALIPGKNEIHICGNLQSQPYVAMTQHALAQFSVSTENLTVTGQQLHSPGELTVEGDWSNAAFFLAAKALGSSLAIEGLNSASVQGDRAILECLKKLDTRCTISAANIPDLIPILAIVAGAQNGAVFTDISRLRLKESDRVASVSAMLRSFGAETIETDDTLTVIPSSYHGCQIDSFGDHRIAMAAAIGATIASGPVIITGSECVRKSYPKFWEVYKQAGGNYEQYIR